MAIGYINKLHLSLFTKVCALFSKSISMSLLTIYGQTFRGFAPLSVREGLFGVQLVLLSAGLQVCIKR